MDLLKSQIENIYKDKGLASNTVKIYTRRLLDMADRLKWVKPNLKFIGQKKRIERLLNKSELSLSTIKSTYIALYTATKYLNLKPNVIEFYKSKMEQARDNNNEVRYNNEPTQSQRDNWASIDELKSVIDMIPDNNLVNFQKRVIVALYTLIPPLRNDYANMKVYLYTRKGKSYNDIKGNRIEVNELNGNMEIVLEDYKTKAQFGTVRIPIPEPLKGILTKWFNEFNINRKWLLVKPSDANKSLRKDDISKLIPSIFKEYINKHITIQLIRNIYETELISRPDYNRMSINDKKREHEKLLHSHITAQEYFKKI